MSNLNKSILDILEEIEITDNEKQFLLKSLELEYKHSDKKRPRLDDYYKSYVEEFSDKNDD